MQLVLVYLAASEKKFGNDEKYIGSNSLGVAKLTFAHGKQSHEK